MSRSGSPPATCALARTPHYRESEQSHALSPIEGMQSLQPVQCLATNLKLPTTHYEGSLHNQQYVCIHQNKHQKSHKHSAVGFVRTVKLPAGLVVRQELVQGGCTLLRRKFGSPRRRALRAPAPAVPLPTPPRHPPVPLAPVTWRRAHPCAPPSTPCAGASRTR
jgi:hypothetical protein